jgi:hypothetical protein
VRLRDGMEFFPGLDGHWTRPNAPPLALRAPQSGRVRVHVHAADDWLGKTMRPLVGARVQQSTQSVITGPEGVAEFVLPVRDLSYGFTADAPGYPQWSTLGDSVVVEVGRVSDCNVYLHRGGVVAGRVVDSRGRPVGDARVEVRDAASTRQGLTESDTLGRFECSTKGDGFRLTVSHKEYEPARVTGVLPDSVVPDIVLRRPGESEAPMK